MKYNYDDKFIKEMISNGYSNQEMSDELSIPYNSLVQYIRRHNLRDSVDRQKIIDDMISRGYHKMTIDEIRVELMKANEIKYIVNEINEDSAIRTVNS